MTATHAGHMQRRCRICDTVIMQCRCLDASKPVVFGTCDQCALDSRAMEPIPKPETVRPLHVLKYDVDQDVVETLRTALRDAERGEIRAVAFACVRQGQETSSTLVAGHGDHTIRLVGVVAHLQYRLHRQLDRNGDG